ncbi:hypothetical protein BKA57DRAFT_495496 [Linnemannia elongata]|nr:hypothetical protein BKA57DRAFT_495496 [Linnemannia elongata]
MVRIGVWASCIDLHVHLRFAATYLMVAAIFNAKLMCLKKYPSSSHKFCLIVLQNLFDLRTIQNSPDRNNSQSTDGTLDPLGKGNLVPWGGEDLFLSSVAIREDVQDNSTPHLAI